MATDAQALDGIEAGWPGIGARNRWFGAEGVAHAVLIAVGDDSLFAAAALPRGVSLDPARFVTLVA